MSSPPDPAKAVAAVTKMKAPAKVRESALELLARLGRERAPLYQRRSQVAKEVGDLCRRARAFGVSYERQAERLGVHRNTLYHNGGKVELGSVEPEPGQVEQVLAELEALAVERRKVNAAWDANGDAMAELVRYVYREFRLPIKDLSEVSGVKRATLYGWLGMARHSATLDPTTGRRTRSLANTGEVPAPRKRGSSGTKKRGTSAR